uniref:LRRNT domain-containing protein n=1 Tax=Capitella teleta TaxID=283909 RepID=X2B9A9_CAPTE
MSLKSNGLKSGEINMLSKLTRLEKLYLDNNALEGIPENLFVPMGELDTLSLTGNQIKSIGPRTFRKVNLGRFYMSGNGLLSIHEDALFSMYSLNEIDLSNNKLRTLTLPRLISNLQSL